MNDYDFKLSYEDVSESSCDNDFCIKENIKNINITIKEENIQHNIGNDDKKIIIKNEEKISKYFDILNEKYFIDDFIYKFLCLSYSNTKRLVEIYLKEKFKTGNSSFDSYYDLNIFIKKMLKKDIFVKKYKMGIYFTDFCTLLPRNWLNDKIINFYFKIIEEYSMKTGKFIKVFSTYFYTTLCEKGIEWVRKWNLNQNISIYELILIPIHKNSHWTLVVVDLYSKSIEYYNSLGFFDIFVCKKIKEYFIATGLPNYNCFGIRNIKNIPKQYNSDDCGVFCCLYARYRIENKEINFVYKKMNSYRKILIHEILAGEILYQIGHKFNIS
ncbi:putative sentrin/sumo-specific protease [Hamiltosporidium magnivora]|uniref:Putative sentrin/sumo-specific protease n=1 Tax=Hamiltosporidium magnivora TaxID=148818 RepID=A0A4Q9LI37_9MICR|nr:putative sentrin/sumo-specific protease [Hamiltosporidium magnivora]